MSKRVLPLMATAIWGLLAGEALASTVHQVYYDAQRKGIVIKFSGAIQASHRQLDDPNRLIIDISQATITGGTRHLNINNAPIKALRIAQYSISPSVVRVVAELKSPISPALQARKGEVFVALDSTLEPLSKAPLEPDDGPIAKPQAKPSPKPVPIPSPVIAVKPTPKADTITANLPLPSSTPYSTIPTSPWLPAPLPTPMPTPVLTPVPVFTPAPVVTPVPVRTLAPVVTPVPVRTPIPAPTPTPAVQVFPIPTPTQAPTPVALPSQCPRSSSLHWVLQQLEINESYPTINSNSSTYGVLSDVRGLFWRHWINDYLGLNMEGRYATFNIFDRKTSLSSQRMDTVAQTGLTVRFPLGWFQPEAQLGYRLRQVAVNTNPDNTDEKSYPAQGNMSLMGPVIGLGARFQIFAPLALTVSGQFTPMTVSAAAYDQFIAITPLGETRAMAGLILDLDPMQFTLGATMEKVLGTYYSQTNTGIMLGVGFGY